MSTAADDRPTGAPPAPAAPPSAHPALGAPQQLHLRDIHTPAAPPAWPPAPGWWLLGVLLLAALLPGFWRLRRAWRRRRRRERIIGELERLGGDCSPALVASVSALLKRAALSCFPHAEVAALTGEDWLAFLDRTGGGGGFSTGAGRVLAEGVYAPRQDCDAPALVALARRWLRHNL